MQQESRRRITYLSNNAARTQTSVATYSVTDTGTGDFGITAYNDSPGSWVNADPAIQFTNELVARVRFRLKASGTHPPSGATLTSVKVRATGVVGGSYHLNILGFNSSGGDLRLVVPSATVGSNIAFVDDGTEREIVLNHAAMTAGQFGDALDFCLQFTMVEVAQLGGMGVNPSEGGDMFLDVAWSKSA